jgi:Cd2+/Zn2+-exporting ATPase
MDNIKENGPESCCSGGCATDEPIPNEISSGPTYFNSLRTTFKVINMDCSDEIKAINDALKMEGVLDVKANLMTSTVLVVHTEKISSEVIKKRINSTIVKVVEDNIETNSNLPRLIKVGISGITLISGILIDYFFANVFVANILFIVAILVGGMLIFPKALSALKRLSLDMNVLMTFAVIGALIIKQYSEASTVVFLFALSELLESFSVQRARSAIGELFKLTPATAILVSDNLIQEVAVEAIQIGETVRVKAGESIPMDGQILVGSSNVNQASLTGESIPVLKVVGDDVFAGTINEEGTLDIKVSKTFENSKLAQVIKLVAESQTQRAPAQKFVDQFAKIYTPLIFICAILTYVIPILLGGDSYQWFYKSLVLLVIACPCALVISTPISIVSALTALARSGVLIKGGAHLEMLGKIKAIALDKTGTLTEGRPEVVKVKTFGAVSEERLLEIALNKPFQ